MDHPAPATSPPSAAARSRGPAGPAGAASRTGSRQLRRCRVLRPTAQRGEVRGRAVALVVGPPVRRVLGGVGHHHGVALALGQHARRGHRRAPAVRLDPHVHGRHRHASHSSSCPAPPPLSQSCEPSSSTTSGSSPSAASAAQAGQPQRRDDARRVDLGRRGVPDSPGQPPNGSGRAAAAGAPWAGRLGVGHAGRPRPGRRPHGHGPDADRAGQSATADLVHADHDPRTRPEQAALEAKIGALARHGPVGGGTWAKVAPGLRSSVARSSGHRVTKATPTTSFIGTAPPPGLPWW